MPVKPLPATKNKREQKKIIAEVRRLNKALGLNPDLRFRRDGHMLIDGKTHEQIDEQYNRTMRDFYRENAGYIDEDRIPDDHYKGLSLPPIFALTAPMGPFPETPKTIVHKFEQKH